MQSLERPPRSRSSDVRKETTPPGMLRSDENEQSEGARRDESKYAGLETDNQLTSNHVNAIMDTIDFRYSSWISSGKT